MRGMDMIRANPRTTLALVAFVGLVLAGGVGGLALAQAQRPDQAPYRSSIQVPDEEDERDEAEEGDDAEDRNGSIGQREEEGREDGESASAAERSEAARYQSLARITAEQARVAALAQIPGTVTGVTLENEDGNLVYGVSITTADGERDVKVDAGNGKVLHVEQGDSED